MNFLHYSGLLWLQPMNVEEAFLYPVWPLSSFTCPFLFFFFLRLVWSQTAIGFVGASLESLSAFLPGWRTLPVDKNSLLSAALLFFFLSPQPSLFLFLGFPLCTQGVLMWNGSARHFGVFHGGDGGSAVLFLLSFWWQQKCCLSSNKKISEWEKGKKSLGTIVFSWVGSQ